MIVTLQVVHHSTLAIVHALSIYWVERMLTSTRRLGHRFVSFVHAVCGFLSYVLSE